MQHLGTEDALVADHAGRIAAALGRIASGLLLSVAFSVGHART